MNVDSNILWVEKYRPRKIEDLVLPENYRRDFEYIIQRKNLPNLLFSGPPGGGKTTIARIICSKNGVLFNKKDNLLMVNGSAKKTRGIGFVDDIVEPFLKHPPVNDSYKVVFIDEADKLTNDGYDSLRGIIEKYQVHYGRFIFTCNYISKIPEAIQSRFTVYTFNQLPKDYILQYCENILKNENISYSKKDLEYVVNTLYPDVRRIVSSLQKCSLDGSLKAGEEQILTLEKKLYFYILEIISYIEHGDMGKVGMTMGQIVSIFQENQDLEYRDIYHNLFFTKEVPAAAKIIINKYSNEHQACLLPHMHFIAMVYDIIKCLTDLKKRKQEGF